MRRDVQEIFRNTPHEKQVMMFSATLSKEIRPVCKKFMQDVITTAFVLFLLRYINTTSFVLCLGANHPAWMGGTPSWEQTQHALLPLPVPWRRQEREREIVPGQKSLPLDHSICHPLFHCHCHLPPHFITSSSPSDSVITICHLPSICCYDQSPPAFMWQQQSHILQSSWRPGHPSPACWRPPYLPSVSHTQTYILLALVLPEVQIPHHIPVLDWGYPCLPTQSALQSLCTFLGSFPLPCLR